MSDLEFRPARPDDEPAILALLRATIGWAADGTDQEFFWWKHRDNPFGTSPAWVAMDGGRVAGYRTLLRWRFITAEGKPVSVVRAVDTATDPAYRGQGIFRRLTLDAVADLTRAGNAFVFNTPNDNSRPGYLSMGWSVVRHLPVGVLPSGPRALVTMARSRTASELWSEPTQAGLDARIALTDNAVCDGLLAHAPAAGLRTDRTAEYLRWRTSFEPLRYRVLLRDPGDPSAGGVIFRVRKRGAGLEAVIAELLVPSARVGIGLLRRVVAETGADYAIGLRTGPSAGLLPLPGQGPLLTARTLARAVPPAADWALTMGDIELF